MTEIIVGVDGSPRGDDAVALARRLAGLTGARIALASAFPYEDFPPSRAADNDFREYLRESTKAMLDRTRATLNGGEVALHAIADVSPARALQRLAEHDGASLIVIGPSHHGRLDRVFAAAPPSVLGGVSGAVLRNAACPVIVLPHGAGAGAGELFASAAEAGAP